MKKPIALILALIMILSLAACGGTAQPPATPEPTPTATPTLTPTPTPTPTPEPTPTPVPEPERIALNETLVLPNMEITFKIIEFSYDVLPDNVSGFYTHYPADPGKVYVHVDADVKNLQKQQMRCDGILKIEVDYNDGYIYTGFAIPEDSTTGFTYANITSIDPLETLGVRFLVDCPEEVAESDNPVKVVLTIDGVAYEYVMR